MSSPKPQPKVPERVYKVGGHTVSKEDYERFVDEMKAMAEKCRQFERISQSQLRPYRKY